MRRRMVWVAVGVMAIMGAGTEGKSRSLALLGMTTGGERREASAHVGPKGPPPQIEEGEFVVKDFRFRDGKSLEELRLHYRTLGKPARDAAGRVSNAVMILHGTGGSGAQFLAPQFAGELFGAGQLLDTAKYYIILPDGIGHGKSSKPSDGLHAKFR